MNWKSPLPDQAQLRNPAQQPLASGTLVDNDGEDEVGSDDEPGNDDCIADFSTVSPGDRKRSKGITFEDLKFIQDAGRLPQRVAKKARTTFTQRGFKDEQIFESMMFLFVSALREHLGTVCQTPEQQQDLMTGSKITRSANV